MGTPGYEAPGGRVTQGYEAPGGTGTPGHAETEQEERNCKSLFGSLVSVLRKAVGLFHEGPSIPYHKLPFTIKQLEEVPISYNQKTLDLLHLKQKNLDHTASH